MKQPCIIRATWICGILFFALAMISTWVKTQDRYALKNSLEKSLSEPTAHSSLPTPSETQVPAPSPSTK